MHMHGHTCGATWRKQWPPRRCPWYTPPCTRQSCWPPAPRPGARSCCKCHRCCRRLFHVINRVMSFGVPLMKETIVPIMGMLWVALDRQSPTVWATCQHVMLGHPAKVTGEGSRNANGTYTRENRVKIGRNSIFEVIVDSDNIIAKRNVSRTYHSKQNAKQNELPGGWGGGPRQLQTFKDSV